MRRPAPLAAIAGAALALCAWAAPAPATPLDLTGTWHVLVHYTDSASAHPDWTRWDDRVWVLARERDALRWVEYPIVVFDDASGRFEKLGTNRQSRVVGAWEPNPGQLAQIEAGLEVNPRGSRSKTLRGSQREGWASGRPIRAFSANTLVYSTVWRIEDPSGLPVFSVAESLSGARAESLEGLTEYRTTEILEGGDVLTGTFTRDGTRVGTFRMRRAGDVADVEGSGKSQEERTMEMLASQFGGGEALAAILGGERVDPEAAGLSRDEIRAEVVEQLEADMREQGMDPAYYRSEIGQMADQILEEWQAGKSPEQIERMIREGEIAPRGLRAPR